jgi:hypothetical protein
MECIRVVTLGIRLSSFGTASLLSNYPLLYCDM